MDAHIIAEIHPSIDHPPRRLTLKICPDSGCLLMAAMMDGRKYRGIPRSRKGMIITGFHHSGGAFAALPHASLFVVYNSSGEHGIFQEAQYGPGIRRTGLQLLSRPGSTGEVSGPVGKIR
jgi:hypothetical protein